MNTKTFINEDFLLQTPVARRLYHCFAAPQPIVDYHCHLSPRDIAEDRRFENLFEIWLEGDHYKWRAMRWNGVPERYCTGDVEPYEKYLAWARTVPHTLRNPLFHWTHLELKRYFGIEELLSEETAPRIWEQAKEQLCLPEFSARGILTKFNVELVGTTDDPTADLVWHQTLVGSGLKTRVVPTFRPDKALNIHCPEEWNAWVNRLEWVSGRGASSLSEFLAALKARHDAFHEIGARMSDHGLERCFALFAPEKEIAKIFQSVRSGRAATMEQREKFATFLMLEVGRWNAEKGWAMQIHLGARRDNNSRLLRAVGPDAGFDSIGDYPQVETLALFLDRLDQDGCLPKTIVYNLNPADNYIFATMLGNFQDGSIPGKMQLGSAWWFLDQKEGIEWQINAVSNLGLLSRFIGMVTDSRSFLSYPRHEYFRRIFCNLIGQDVAEGRMPDDDFLLGPLVRSVCCDNARSYFL